jgi:hypothetical protein
VGGVTAPDLVPVRMQQVPVRLWAASQEHVDELLREFALMTAGLEQDDADGPSSPVPLRLVRLVADVTARFSAAGDEARAELFAAAADDVELLDEVVYHLPAAAGPASLELGRMLDEADDYCRAGQHLLTLATPPELVQFRRWYLGQVVDQLAGGAPVPWTAYRDPAARAV